MAELDVQGAAVEEDAGSTAGAHCRHCGQPNDNAVAGGDWQCPSCEQYQDTMACPTCGNPARISLMPEDLVPAPHAPARRRRSGGQ